MQGKAVGAVCDRGAYGDSLGFQHEVIDGKVDPAECDLMAVMDVSGFKPDQGAAKRVGFLDESPLRYDSNCVEAAPEFAETADAALARVSVRGQAVGAVSDHGDVGGRVDGDQFVEVPPRRCGNCVEDAPRHAAETADAVLAHGRMQGQAVGAVRDRGACGDPLGFQHEVSGGGRDPAESDLEAIMEVGGACYDKGGGEAEGSAHAAGEGAEAKAAGPWQRFRGDRGRRRPAPRQG